MSILTLPIEGLCVVCPVQHIVYAHSKELVRVQRLYFNPLDGNGGWGLPAQSEVHHLLLDLADVELEVVLLGPSDEAFHPTSVPVLSPPWRSHPRTSVGGTFPESKVKSEV